MHFSKKLSRPRSVGVTETVYKSVRLMCYLSELTGLHHLLR